LARDGEIDLQEDREIPACAQFGAVQKNAVHDQRRCGWRLLRLRRDGLIGAMAEMSCDVVARSVRPKRIEQEPAKRRIVVGIEEEAVR